MFVEIPSSGHMHVKVTDVSESGAAPGITNHTNGANTPRSGNQPPHRPHTRSHWPSNVRVVRLVGG